MQKIVLASNNVGKLREFSAMFAPLDIVCHAQAEFDVSEADEPHGTFVENALAKARHAARATGLPALADDSGLCVPVLGGAPGVYSARYAGEPKSDARNNERLIQMLAGQTDRRAYYYCVLVLLRSADDPQPLIAEGMWQGEIVDVPQGVNGFGYDAHFWVPEFGATVAQLMAEDKNRISHRAQALRALLARLQ